MSYIELGYEFMEYFVSSINQNHQNLIQAITEYTMLTVNDEEVCGSDQIMYCLNYIQIHNLIIEQKNVLIQPLYWNNVQAFDYGGLVILASGHVNILENGIMVNKNVHFNFTLQNHNGSYYITNILMRLSEKSRPITNYNNQFNQQYNRYSSNRMSF